MIGLCYSDIITGIFLILRVMENHDFTEGLMILEISWKIILEFSMGNDDFRIFMKNHLKNFMES